MSRIDTGMVAVALLAFGLVVAVVLVLLYHPDQPPARHHRIRPRRYRPQWKCPSCSTNRRHPDDVPHHYCGSCHHYPRKAWTWLDT